MGALREHPYHVDYRQNGWCYVCGVRSVSSVRLNSHLHDKATDEVLSQVLWRNGNTDRRLLPNLPYGCLVRESRGANDPISIPNGVE